MTAWVINPATLWAVGQTFSPIPLARTFDDRLYVIDCTGLLAPGQTISGTPTVTNDEGVLTCSNVLANVAAATNPLTGAAIAIGQALQVELKCTTPGAAIPDGGGVLLTIRARFATSTDPAVEATVRLWLCDTPGTLVPGGGAC